MKKIITVILSLVLVIQICDFSVFASMATRSNSAYFSAESKDVKPEDAYTIIDEIYSERNAFSKTFLLTDGSFYSITASTPIHICTNGEWTDINENWATPNSIKEAESMINGLIVSADKDNAVAPTNNRMIIEDDDDSLMYRFLGDNNDNNTICSTGNCAMWVKPTSISLSAHGCQIATTEAKITLDVSYYKKQTGSSYVDTYEVNSNWDNNINYTLVSNLPNTISFSNRAIDTIKISSVGSYIWDITDTFCKWERDVLTNNGVIFTTTGRNVIRIGGFSISRKYRLISENDSDFSYQSIDIGRAGTLYINEYTGTLKLKREECGIDGNIMPVSVSRVIDFGYKTTSMNYSGIGSRWNYNSVFSSLTTDIYRWNTLEGEIIYFIRPDQSSIIYDNEGRQKWSDVDGEYSLWININYSFLNDYSFNYIADSNENKYYFDVTGRVTSIEDINGNTISIHYSNNGQIDYILDGVVRCYKFIFGNLSNPSGYSGIKSLQVYSNISENADTIQFDDTDYIFDYQYVTVPNLLSGFTNIALGSVLYPDGEEVTYTYDSSTGNLTSIQDIDGTLLSIDYVSPYSNRVSCLTKTKGGHILQKIEINLQNTYLREFEYNTPANPEAGYTPISSIIRYNNNLDVIYRRNSDGTECYYRYDQNGNLTSIIIPENGSNLVSSGDFEGNNSTYWYEGDGTIYSFEQINGNKVLKVTANEQITSNVIQEIVLTGEVGDQFVIFGTMKSSSSLPVHSRNVKIEVRGVVYDEYLDDLVETIIGYTTFDNTLINNYQTSFGSFVYSDTIESYDFLTINIVVNNQNGDFYFDNVGIYKADNGVINLNENTGEQICCGCVNCQNGSCVCECINNGNSNCVCCNTQDVTSYDSFGNIVKSGISVNGVELSESKQYTSNGNYFTKTIDVNGVETTYYFNADNGALETVSEGTNDDIVYSYNAMGMLTEVTQAVASLSNTDASVLYTYTHDRITTITHNGITYNFVYDDYGNCTSEQVKDNTQAQKSIVSYLYNNDYTDSNINTITYGNGDYIHYEYDENNCITEIYVNTLSSPRYEYEYNSNGTIASSTDNETGLTTTYGNNGEYIITDSNDQVLYSTTTNNNGQFVEDIFGESYIYGNTTIPAEGAFNYNCLTGESNIQTILSIPYDYNIVANSNNDEFNRVINRQYVTDIDSTVQFTKFNTNYEYHDTSTKATNQIASFTTTHKDFDESHFYYGIGENYNYDSNGRVTAIERVSGLQYDPIYHQSINTSYVYDSNGQLIRENNEDLNKTFVYYYNPYGNISSVETFPYTTSSNLGTPINTDIYSYNSNYNDLLSSINNQSFIYDAVGNPISFGSDYLFEWEGKQLKSYKCPYTVDDNTGDQNEYQIIEYDYDSEGNRTKKTVSLLAYNSNQPQLHLTTYYIWNNGKLIAQKTVNPDNSTGNKYRYLYDSDGEPYGIVVNDSGIYYYIKDQFGSVISIYSESNHMNVVTYKYDAWGNATYYTRWDNIGQLIASMLIAMNNSITYKGYCYDEESNLYLLQSRYYNPQWKRFVNSDNIYVTGHGVFGANLYSYCANDPVNMFDPKGNAYQGKATSVVSRFIASFTGEVLLTLACVTRKDIATLQNNIPDIAEYFYVSTVIYSGKKKTTNSFEVCHAFTNKQVSSIVAKYYAWVEDLGVNKIKKEIFAHSMLYYYYNNIKAIIGENKAKEIRKHADPIDLGGNPLRYILVFELIWDTSKGT